MRYGLPYKGSKSKIAEWIVEQLPPSEVFVDIFMGGGAVTHAAMLSGKWERFIANDISGTPILFRNAISGEFDGYSEVPSRDDFFLSDDAALRLLYSFGNDAQTYLWGDEYERVKVPASRMLSAPSVHERRKYYRDFIKALRENVKVHMERASIESLEGLTRLQALERLQGLQALERLQVMVSDYRNVKIPDWATVYADPPYRNTSEHYGGFDFDAFDKWLAEVDFPVYVSEYDAPDGCVCIAERKVVRKLDGYKSNEITEKLFIQERFANEIS